MRGRILSLAVTLTLMIGVSLIADFPGRAQSGGQQPDYSQVDDFVNGKTHLLRNDDLVLTFAFFRNGNSSQARNVLFSGGTQNSKGYFVSFDQAMPANTRVKVRFYGMQLDSQNFPVGASSLINEVTLTTPIPPFSTDPGAPLNWVLASTNFNTTGRADQALAFWVVVWMEDANENLVQELANHGLTGKPPAGQTSTFDAITNLEEMISNPLKQSDNDPDMISFSNNIGFYRFAFHVLPKNSGSLRTARAASLLSTLNVAKVEVGGKRLKPGDSVEGSVTLQNGDQDLFGVMVYFYDGDPAKGGRLVDVERLGRLRASSQQKVSILFRPRECGSHLLYVRVAPGRPHAVNGSANRQVWVECPEAACFAPVCMNSAQQPSLSQNQFPARQIEHSRNPQSCDDD